MLCVTKLDRIKHFLCNLVCSDWGRRAWWRGWEKGYDTGYYDGKAGRDKMAPPPIGGK